MLFDTSKIQAMKVLTLNGMGENDENTTLKIPSKWWKQEDRISCEYFLKNIWRSLPLKLGRKTNQSCYTLLTN